MSFFGELKRRNVIRVAIGYSIVAWLVAQVAELALDSFGSPDWVMKTLLLLLAIGLPIAIVFAWAFEMTPEGVKREKDVDRSTSITEQTGRKINVIIISVLVIALGFSVITHRWTGSDGTDTAAVTVPAQNAASSDQSIAVLPFVNMSEDEDNEYFSDGISEELLNVLVRVEGLRVASRTSSFAFKGKDASIPLIAESLGVAHILEGSVRKAGDTVRVTAQLIDARTDKHLWSETYDRKLEDIFAIQDEISAHIVAALKIALGTEEQAVLSSAATPTDNLDAYENYLRGRYLWQRRGAENIGKAIALFQKATEQDATFARAWSSLAGAHITMPTYSNEPSDDHYPRALEYAEKALSIDPSIAEAHAVLGELARTERHWSDAEVHYRHAIANEPKNSTSYLWYAEHLQCTGRIGAALQTALIAYRLDPLHQGTNQVLGEIYESHGDFLNAEKYSRNAVDAGHLGGMIEVTGMRMLDDDFEAALSLSAKTDIAFGQGGDLFVRRTKAYQDSAFRKSYFETLEADPENIVPIFFLRDYANLGRVDDAFSIASDPGAFIGNSRFTLWRHDMSRFRQDPRFTELVVAAGYVDYWNEYGWPPACEQTDGKIVCQ